MPFISQSIPTILSRPSLCSTLYRPEGEPTPLTFCCCRRRWCCCWFLGHCSSSCSSCYCCRRRRRSSSSPTAVSAARSLRAAGETCNFASSKAAPGKRRQPSLPSRRYLRKSSCARPFLALVFTASLRSPALLPNRTHTCSCSVPAWSGQPRCLNASQRCMLGVVVFPSPNPERASCFVFAGTSQGPRRRKRPCCLMAGLLLKRRHSRISGSQEMKKSY